MLERVATRAGVVSLELRSDFARFASFVETAFACWESSLSVRRRAKRADLAEVWLRSRDSNPDNVVQSRATGRAPGSSPRPS